MFKRTDKTKSGGRIQIFEDFHRRVFMAKPSGMVNPSLVAVDLNRAREFSEKVEGRWTYVTNTENVLMVNPFNLLYLKEVKKLPRLEQIVIFVPNALHRFLLKMASFIVQPDRIIKTKAEFNLFMTSKV